MGKEHIIQNLNLKPLNILSIADMKHSKKEGVEKWTCETKIANIKCTILIFSRKEYIRVCAIPVVLTKDTMAWLKKVDRLHISDEGRVLRPSCYKKWLRKILEKAGLKTVTLHSLRHTNITIQLTSGVDVRAVAARAGHSRTSTTTDIYPHFIKSRDEHASKVIDAVFED